MVYEKLNANQKAMRKGYQQIAKALGSKYGVYRPVSDDVPVTDVRNWQFDIYFSPTLNNGYQTPKEFGLPLFKGNFDNTTIEVGDFFYDYERTYYVTSIPIFEPATVVQCFNDVTISSRSWDSDTRSFVETVIVNRLPCNIQPDGKEAYSRDQDDGGASNSDHSHKWVISTYLHPQSNVKLNDRVLDDDGNESSITMIQKTQHGHKIYCTQLKDSESAL